MGKSNFSRSEAPVQRASEPYFPRGKEKKDRKVVSTYNKEKAENHEEPRFVKLFGETAKKREQEESEKKKRIQERKKIKKEQKSIFDVIANNVPSLTYEDLKEGMVMTATVASISDYKVVVCLPFYLHATLAITNISAKFTELLRTAAHDNTEDNMDVDDIPSMEGLFRVGEFLVVAISSINKNDQDVYDVNVTVDPKMVMSKRNIKQGDICVASVKSKEEYGYVMDLEGTNCSGFISKDSADLYRKNLPLGSVVICYVAKKHGHVLTLKCDQDKLYQNLKNPSDASLYNTMPGSLIRTKVEQVMENGIKVSYGTNAFGYIHQNLLPSNHDDPKKYTEGQEVVARIVMVLPTLNSFIMSAKSFYPNQNNWVSNCSFGEVFTDALIRQVTDDQLSLTLKEGLRGVAPLAYARNIGMKINRSLKRHYEAGRQVKCRVIYLDHYSGQAVVTLLKEHLQATEMEGRKIGDIVTATVKGYTDAGVEVFVDGKNGFIRKDFLSDTPVQSLIFTFPVGHEVECKIVALDPERNFFLLTSKQTLVKSQAKIFTSSDVEVGDESLGVVKSISDDQHMAVVSFYNHVRGYLFLKSMEDLYVGKTINCAVVKVNHETGRIVLKRLAEANMQAQGRKPNMYYPTELKIGLFYAARITKVTNAAFEVAVECMRNDVKALVPFYHLTDCQAMTETIKDTYKVNDYIRKLMYVYDDQQYGIPVLTAKESLKGAHMSKKYVDNFASLTKDCDILGVVKSIEDDYMLIDTLVQGCKQCVVPFKNIILPDGDQLQDILEVGQTIVTQMLSKSEDKKEVTATCDLTGEKHISRNYSTEYLKGLVETFRYLGEVEKNKRLSKFKIGMVYDAKVKSVTDMGATLELEGGVTGLAPASNYGHNKPEPDTDIKVLVLFVDYQTGVLEVCCDEILVKPRLDAIEANDMTYNTGLGVGTVLKGEIVLTRTELNLQLMYVMDPPRNKGKIVYVPDLYDEIDEDNKETRRNVIEISVKYKTRNRELIGTDEQEIITRKRDIEESGVVPKKKIKSELPHIQIPDEVYREYLGKKAAEKYIKKEIKQEVDDTTFSSGVNMDFSEDNKDDIVLDTSVSAASSKPALEDPGWDFSANKITLPAWGKVSIWGDEESESDNEDEDDEKTDGKKKEKTRISKKEAKQMRKQEELEAVRQENKIIQGENLPPQTPEEFERTVASSPDSSLVWIQYMAHFLQSCQYDQAREIAKTAVNRINFREETEILNVYLAWLNLENAFGNSDSLDEVLKEAVQRNDEYKVYSQMADIFDKSSKVPEAERIFKTLTRKFAKVKEVWVRYGLLFFKHSRVEDGRYVFTRALKNLETRDAADVSAKFAQLEFKYGDQERGKTMYEKLVSTYPKRIDIWRSYADQLTRIGDIPATRALYTRISTLGLKAKKMKPLFAKWLEFETTYGTEEQQGLVRAAALKYLNTKLAEDETVHDKIQEIKSSS